MNQYDTTLLEKGMDTYSISLTDRQICQFLTYYELLIEWNSVMNLTGITEYEEVVTKHFIDSLSLAGCVNLRKIGSVIDVGTGAGFPGIPLKIVFPHLKITLLDSLKKRICFLDEVIKKLELADVETLHGRAEDYARPGLEREQYDLSVSRAVANLTTLAEYCLPFVRKGGFFVSYKQEKVTEELDHAEKAIRVLGGKIKEKKNFILPDSDLHRTILLIEKIKETPARFPRKAGTPSKEPLFDL